MTNYQGAERRKVFMEITTLASRMQSLHEDVSEIKTAIKELTSAITKLALVEERQQQATIAQERAFSAIQRLETRIGDIEKQMPLHNQTSQWVERAVIAVVVGVIGWFIGGKR